MKKASNKNLHKARDSKKDEFYTQLCDIELELKNYKIISKIKLFIAIATTRELAIFFIIFRTILRN